MTHIFVLEDNFLLQRRLIEIVSEFEICTRISYSSSILECKKQLLEGDVDVLLADLKLPDGSGRECIKLFSKINPNSISIVMSALSDGNSIIGALEDGAIGYLHKDDNSLQITDAIKMALNGQSPMSPSIAYTVISRIQTLGSFQMKKTNNISSHGILTPRELEVLNMIAKGLSYSETATSLDISEKTVPVHIRNIYKKLQATNRSEAVFEARAAGIIV
ncbi:LuxR family two component transcriptional regulator [Loktanella sp. PT4BL]|jgi:DNA-binding NarL/FixJ family response regulator|uniref:LuxR C-terminal-related transcriptional regulator n=1 Tax=Loktanella sp. PT4BL TaxID=2135611 RepID=UPI000D76A719|nr:response regulator transcription factor [Loktanella sp. PT4BL]PXW65586.1 LuxR family two component transcriptional regulator [Loktanella sp. PT4BL]